MQTIYCNWWDAEEPRKGARDIDGQKSNQEKIKIRTLRTVGHGTRLAKSSPTLAKDARVGHPGGLGGSRAATRPRYSTMPLSRSMSQPQSTRTAKPPAPPGFSQQFPSI